MISQTSSLPVTVLILAEHLDETLQDCLNQTAWAREVIIAWNGPTSESELLAPFLAKRNNTKLIHIPEQIIDFAATRNAVQTHATQPWVFWIDSDEVLTPESIPQIVTFIQDQSVNGVFVRRFDVFAGRVLHWGEVKNVQLLRLFRRSAGQYHRPVHELANVAGRLSGSTITLYHYAHPSIARFFQKIIRYVQQEATYRQQLNLSCTLPELVIWPSGKFLYNMFIRWAFLDGWQGITYAFLMSMHSFAVRAMVLEQHVKTSADKNSVGVQQR